MHESQRETDRETDRQRETEREVEIQVSFSFITYKVAHLLICLRAIVITPSLSFD